MGSVTGSQAGHQVVFALGPTNTGKTHRALERMLDYSSGMIGLPLRLLAREVYDRLCSRLGQDLVALVTGEERRVPKRPAYWVCTVEAMPGQLAVDFVAVDEIQLAGHPQRGHVFTDRLLHARGRRETWFLGAESARSLLQRFVPEGRVERSLRFSQLRYGGRHSLRSLPPRSAVVAFTSHEVYGLAERLRRLRGGVAVVLGALSPRTRNAQVAMFQAGEVQHLVATDAIGMGLNLDLNHVAFAGLEKFDGQERRALSPGEMGQIAGRAGRHVRDGTFGCLKPLPELGAPLVSAIEAHRFASLRRLYYRNTALDYSSLESLRRSLTAPVPDPKLIRVVQADDLAALQHLERAPAVKALATDPSRVGLLWEVCQVPNFRKQLPSDHAATLLPLFEQLCRQGVLNPDELERELRRLDDVQGDIATLTDRLERVRTYSYLSQRRGWLADPLRLQTRTRDVEDCLGDALHALLVARFVSRQARRTRRRPSPPARSEPAVAGAPGPFAQLAVLRDQLSGGAPDDGEDSEDAFVARVEAAAHDAFLISHRGAISFEGERLARLAGGRDLRRPSVVLHEPEVWSAGARQRLERRLRALALDVVSEADGGLHHLRAGLESRQAGGVVYALEQGLGLLQKREAERLLRAVPAPDRLRFTQGGLVMGRQAAYLAPALQDGALRRRGLLVRLVRSQLQPSGPVEPLECGSGFDGEGDAFLLGYVLLSGGFGIRVDLFEELAKHRPGDPASDGDFLGLVASLALPVAARRRLLSKLDLVERPEGTLARRRRKRRRKARGQAGPQTPAT